MYYVGLLKNLARVASVHLLVLFSPVLTAVQRGVTKRGSDINFQYIIALVIE